MLISKFSMRKSVNKDISFFYNSDWDFNIQGPPCVCEVRTIKTCTFSTTYRSTRTFGTTDALNLVPSQGVFS